MNTTIIPSNVTFTSFLVFCRIRVNKDICRLIVTYLYETVGESNIAGCKTVYTVINGVKHGLSREWYKSGRLMHERMYADGDYHGLSRYWYESGERWFEYMYKNGEIHGITRGWYESGKLKYEFMYKDGERHGLARYWHKSGRLIYEDGKKTD